MSVQRFNGKTSRAVLKDVRRHLGDDAVIISNRTTRDGVEVLAMAANDMDHLVENAGTPYRSRAGLSGTSLQKQRHLLSDDEFANAENADASAHADDSIAVDTSRHAPPSGDVREVRDMRDMLLRPAKNNTHQPQTTPPQGTRLGGARFDEPETFDAYLKRARGPQLNVAASTTARGASSRPMATTAPRTTAAVRAVAEYESVFAAQMDTPETLPPIPVMSSMVADRTPARQMSQRQQVSEIPIVRQPATPQPIPASIPATRTTPVMPPPQMAMMSATTEANTVVSVASVVAPARPQTQVSQPAADAALMSELKSMKGLLQNQLAQLAFSDMSRKNPVQGKLLAKLIQAGFSAQLARTLVDKINPEVNEEAANEWISQALTQNLRCTKLGEDMVERGGIYALVGPTGVGKTTTTAKLAARCVMKHGARKLGLITIDNYRIGAQDQLKMFGKMLGVPVHIAHDQASLHDLLLAMRDRHLVLIDTVGMPQRDPRMGEQLNMLMGSGIERVMVLNAASQAETLEEVIQAWRGPRCRRALITKMDEAAKLGGVVDAAIRHQLVIDFVTNGQRVPEDIHNANGSLLVHRALRATTPAAFQFKSEELVLAAVPQAIANHKGAGNA
jgi:flagellar biosynthesis protein FlhF